MGSELVGAAMGSELVGAAIDVLARAYKDAIGWPVLVQRSWAIQCFCGTLASQY